MMENRLAKRDSVHIQMAELELKQSNERANTNAAPTQVPGGAHAVTPTTSSTSASTATTTTTAFTSTLFKILFFAHLVLFGLLVSFLTIRGFLSPSPSFDALSYHVPLLASATLSAPFALLPVLIFTLRSPTTVFHSAFCLSPALAICLAFLLLAFANNASVSIASFVIFTGVVQALYACWVKGKRRRVRHAERVMSNSLAALEEFSGGGGVGKYVVAVVAIGAVYSWFWVMGVAGVAAAESKRFGAVYVSVLLLSLAWTMQVLRNIVHVFISRIAHAQLARRPPVPITAHDSFHGASDARRPMLGHIILGSVASPTVGLIRSAARGVDLLSGADHDEFMCSCAGCFLGLANRLAAHANRWGLVQVGVHGKGFAKASEDTWGLFRQRGMAMLIDDDVTGAFCFFCGTGGGSLVGLVCGAWMFAVDKGYATGPTAYAFLIGYFMVRIAMAWPQACVSAYHVVYAENPNNELLGSAIPDRIRDLEQGLH